MEKPKGPEPVDQPGFSKSEVIFWCVVLTITLVFYFGFMIFHNAR